MNNTLTMIDTLYRRQIELASYLKEKQEWSFATEVEAYLSKTVLLSIASYFESRITEAISLYVSRVSQEDEALTSLVRIRVIERQYHTYFDWPEKSSGVMKFFSMFGPALKEAAKRDLKKEELLRIAAESFLELGNLRNLLVHKNFASYSLENTPAEIYALYQSAAKFIQYVEDKLNPRTPLTESPEE